MKDDKATMDASTDTNAKKLFPCEPLSSNQMYRERWGTAEAVKRQDNGLQEPRIDNLFNAFVLDAMSIRVQTKLNRMTEL